MNELKMNYKKVSWALSNAFTAFCLKVYNGERKIEQSYLNLRQVTLFT